MIMNRETNPEKNKITNLRFQCMILKYDLMQAQSKLSHSKSKARVMQEMLEVETVLRRILWEFCCECWKREYASIYLKCEIE